MATSLPQCSLPRRRLARNLFILWTYILLLVGSARAEPSQVVFKDKTAELGLQAPNAAGCWADFDNDGLIDLFS
ncbi:MAG: hypothetical protein QGF59_22360, partial [Pirellulaceae bacterium]|nr:hypothetical protein [Pirellulaceae bacterium]